VTSRHVVGGAVLGAVAGFASSTGLLDPVPDVLRVLVAFLVVVLLPGVGWLVAIGARTPGGGLISLGWALPMGIAWTGLVLWVLHLTHRTLLASIDVAWWLGLVPWLTALWSRPRVDPAGREADRLRGVWLAVVIVAAAIAAVHVARCGAPFSYYSDTPDHVATIRRMLETGQVFPTDAFFLDAGVHGVDPRKGLWHPQVAWISALSRVDPIEVWSILAACLAPLFVLNAAAFGFLLRGPRTAGFAAWALLLTYGGSLGAPYLREAVFSTKLADQCALAAMVAMLADLAHPTRRSRLAVVAVLAGAVLAHVFATIHFGLVTGSLAVGLWIRDRWRGTELPRLAGSAGLALLVVSPYLLWRAFTAYAPGNVIHTEPQGLLEWGAGWRTVSPGVLWDWMGLAWIVLPASIISWWRHSWRTPVLLLLSTTIAVFTLLFLPPVTTLLQPRLGYLLLRFVWILPLSVALAFALDALLLRLRRDGWRKRTAGVIGLLGLAAVLSAPVTDAFAVLLDPRAVVRAEREVSVLRWREPMRRLDTHLPARTVVLSDPATSYAVPMFTRHHVATLVDQHSSPNDPHALDRILDARDALDPRSPWSRMREVVRRWGVTAIVLNGRFEETPRLDYWAPSQAWFHAARARLDAHPAAFPRSWDLGDFVVYGIEPAALEALQSVGDTLEHHSPAQVAADRQVSGVGEGVDLSSFALSRRIAAPGDSITARFVWVARRPLPAGQYDVFMRFDRALPDGVVLPSLLAKPGRKLLERIHRERYRFRHDHTPTSGTRGLDRWRPGESIADSMRFSVPLDAAPGEWQVQLRIARQPHYPNYWLRDYFLDRDYYSGAVVDSLTVTPARRSREGD